MRIGIDVTAAISQKAGIGRYTRELVQALMKVDDQNDYHLLSARQPASSVEQTPFPKNEKIHHHSVPISERWLYRLWYRLRLPLPVQLMTGRLDLFHSPDFVLPPVSGGIPTLLTVHDLSFIHYPETFPTTLINYLNTVVPWSVRRAAHILADSQATKNDLVQIWRVPAEKITVLYSGVNKLFRPEADEERLTAVRLRYHLGDEPYVLSVGTVQPRKNYQMLIRAFRPVAKKYPHNLVIAGGKGWLSDEMLAEVKQQGLADRVRFIGFVADADLPVLYNGATLFAMPSLYEGFGLPLLEAMACGVPVLASNTSSLPEVVGETAVLLPPQDEPGWARALQKLLADPDSRRRMSAAGVGQAAKFSWQKSASQLLRIYEELL